MGCLEGGRSSNDRMWLKTAQFHFLNREPLYRKKGGHDLQSCLPSDDGWQKEFLMHGQTLDKWWLKLEEPPAPSPTPHLILLHPPPEPPAPKPPSSRLMPSLNLMLAELVILVHRMCCKCHS